MTSPWCCPIHPDPRWKSGWPESRNASATRGRGGIGFLTNAVPARAEAVKMRKRSVGEIQRLVAANVNRQVTSSSRESHERSHKRAPNSRVSASRCRAGRQPGTDAAAVGGDPGEIEAAKKKFGLDKIARPIFGLNPGAEYGPAKRWPVEKFIAAAREIQKRTELHLVDVRRPGRHRPLPARSHPPSPVPPFAIWNLAGKTSLRELMALLKVCRVLLTNDSGPMHVAAALGTPVVVPFGSTSPELTGPGLPGDARNRLLKSDAPCAPCFLRECPIDFRCLNGISVERVVEAVLETHR